MNPEAVLIIGAVILFAAAVAAVGYVIPLLREERRQFDKVANKAMLLIDQAIECERVATVAQKELGETAKMWRRTITQQMDLMHQVYGGNYRKSMQAMAEQAYDNMLRDMIWGGQNPNRPGARIIDDVKPGFFGMRAPDYPSWLDTATGTVKPKFRPRPKCCDNPYCNCSKDPDGEETPQPHVDQRGDSGDDDRDQRGEGSEGEGEAQGETRGTGERTEQHPG